MAGPALLLPMWARVDGGRVAHLWTDIEGDWAWEPVCGVALWEKPGFLLTPEGAPHCERCEKWLRDRMGRFPHLEE